MEISPVFPQFKPIGLEDRDLIREICKSYQPETSEWTFTNLFIWRSHYQFQWSMYRDWLLVLSQGLNRVPFAMGPLGPPSRAAVTRLLLEWLREEKGERAASIERADQRLISELGGSKDFLVDLCRDHFDYVYRTQDMIRLPGRKYHAKRNHINRFHRSSPFSYVPLREEHLKPCLELADNWCDLRRCEEDLGLMGEWDAIKEAFAAFHALQVQGGVILIEGNVKAFALGELLNDRTAIVHIEKADPLIPGLYALINQQFCENHWRDVTFINREQDLGEPGLRKAKLSYYPDHLAEKYRIRLDD